MVGDLIVDFDSFAKAKRLIYVRPSYILQRKARPTTMESVESKKGNEIQQSPNESA